MSNQLLPHCSLWSNPIDCNRVVASNPTLSWRQWFSQREMECNHEPVISREYFDHATPLINFAVVKYNYPDIPTWKLRQPDIDDRSRFIGPSWWSADTLRYSLYFFYDCHRDIFSLKIRFSVIRHIAKTLWAFRVFLAEFRVVVNSPSFIVFSEFPATVVYLVCVSATIPLRTKFLARIL